MAWSIITTGTLHGITSAIAGITCPVADVVQVCSAQTYLLAEVAGICTTLYNGAMLQADGGIGDTKRAFSATLVPLNLAL